MDFPATALVLCASLCLLLALEYGGVTHPWSSSLVVGLLVGFVLIVAALVAIEIWQGERAMLTPRLLHQRTVLVPGIWGFFFAGAYFVTLYYLPIYFQAIDDVSPIGSGVRNIPLIAMFSIATYGSGVTITKTGVAAPYMTIGSVLVTIAAGLLFTLDIGTSTGKWVGYQLLAGFGYGVALQVPVVVAQAFAKPSDIAPVTAIIICKYSRLSSTVSWHVDDFLLSWLSARHGGGTRGVEIRNTDSSSTWHYVPRPLGTSFPRKFLPGVSQVRQLLYPHHGLKPSTHLLTQAQSSAVSAAPS
jgi:hypothetical protein